MRIQAFTTKGGHRVPVGRFSVFVGPNNVGKSQTLRDLHDLLVRGSACHATIVDRLEAERPAAFEDLLTGLDVAPHPDAPGIYLVRGVSPRLLGGETVNVDLAQLRQQFNTARDLSFTFGNLAKLRVSYLDAGSRLLVAQETASLDPQEGAPQNLLQALFVASREVDKKLMRAFEDTFGMQIRLDYSGMTHFRFRIANRFTRIPSDPRRAGPIMRSYQKLDEQGDGFKSFVGVVLSLLLSEGRLVLLDEPEAFLHPAQARTLGRWLGARSGEFAGQVIVATHDDDFLAGIIGSGAAVDVFRLSRSGNTTTYAQIPSEITSELATDPVLSSQRILSSIFFKGVVVCEADADRAVYQAVAHVEHEEQGFFFVHAHNKQTIPRVVQALRGAGVPVCAIVDIDVLNSLADLGHLLEALTEPSDLPRIEQLRAKVATAVEGMSEDELLANVTADVLKLAGQLQAGDHNLSGAKGALNRLRKSASKWTSLKAGGIAALPVRLRPTARAVLKRSKTYGLFVVPKGELESWIDVGTRRKRKWVIRALRSIGDGDTPKDLRDFVGEVIAFLKADEDEYSQ